MTHRRPGTPHTPGPTRRRMRAVVVGWALLGSLLLAACGGGGGSGPTPQDALAQARTALDETSGVQLSLAVSDLPAGVNGLLAADGTATHDPAFEGTIKVAALGVTVDADVIATGGKVYAVLPFTTRYAEIDPADYSAPDPARLMSTEDGLSSLLTEADQVAAGDKVRDGDEVLATYTGVLSGEVVAGIIPSADPAGSFDSAFTVAADDTLTRVVLTGPFYPDAADVTYTIDLSGYGTEKDIAAP